MFSKTTKYGLRAIIYVALNATKEKKTDVQKIAKELDVPQHFLAKILQVLSRAGIVSSSKGPGGGFYFDEKNSDKYLTEVIVCLEGRNLFNDCILGLPECGDTNPCVLHHQVKAYKQGLNKELEQSTIAELVKSVKEGDNKFRI